MIRDLKTLYVAINENKVVFFDTNLSKFITGLKLLEPNIKSYQYYNKEFKKNKTLIFVNRKNKVYFLQKVL